MHAYTLVRGVALALLVVLSPAMLARGSAATVQPRDAEAIKEEARKVLGGGGNSNPNDKSNATRSDGKWCIAIVSLRGPERDEAAGVALARMRSEGKLPEAYADRRSNATIIAVGKFDSADDERAKAELKRIQELEIDGLPIYGQAFLCPPEADENLGSTPEYNLLKAKETYGSAAIQTLQVGVYGRDDLKKPTEEDLAECRKLAETAAVKLRQEGELAFYYHGPRRSMVTIGVFDLNDYDPQLPNYNSPRLMAAKKRHPYNLYNGQGIRESDPQGKKGTRLQPSTLVAIPDAPASSGPRTTQPPR